MQVLQRNLVVTPEMLAAFKAAGGEVQVVAAGAAKGYKKPKQKKAA